MKGTLLKYPWVTYWILCATGSQWNDYSMPKFDCLQYYPDQWVCRELHFIWV